MTRYLPVSKVLSWSGGATIAVGLYAIVFQDVAYMMFHGEAIDAESRRMVAYYRVSFLLVLVIGVIKCIISRRVKENVPVVSAIGVAKLGVFVLCLGLYRNEEITFLAISISFMVDLVVGSFLCLFGLSSGVEAFGKRASKVRM